MYNLESRNVKETRLHVDRIISDLVHNEISGEEILSNPEKFLRNFFSMEDFHTSTNNPLYAWAPTTNPVLCVIKETLKPKPLSPHTVADCPPTSVGSGCEPPPPPQPKH